MPGKRTLTEQLTAQIQMRSDRPARKLEDGAVQAAAAEGVSSGGGRLAHADRIASAFGDAHADTVRGITAHTDGAAAEATSAIGAQAYATGTHVALAPGAAHDLHTEAHEAAHVVQQKAGVSLYGGVGQVGDPYELQADAVADRVVAGRSAADLLSSATYGGSTPQVQRKIAANAADGGAAEPEWVREARAYNKHHHHHAETFAKATQHVTLGPDGEHDPVTVARWQKDHGIDPDGRIGPHTADAATKATKHATGEPRVTGASVGAPPGPTPAHAPTPAPTPAHAPTPASAPVVSAPTAHVVAAPAPGPEHAAAPAPTGEAIHKVYKLPRPLPSVHAFLPPGGVKGPAEVFLFMHGKFAHHEADPHPEQDQHLAQAMAQTNRNLITLAPAADFGGSDGEWPLWSKLGGKGGDGYARVIASTVELLNKELAPNPAITVAGISVAGHSAGGSALGDAATQLGDLVHDMTMEDGGYTGGSFTDSHQKVVEWILGGQTDKLLRVIVHQKQNDKKTNELENKAEGGVLRTHFNETHIRATAKKLGLKVEVSPEKGNDDARSVETMSLDHRLHIKVDGAPAARTISVYRMNQDHGFKSHMDTRNKVNERLITEGRDTDFAGSPMAEAVKAAAPTPAPAPTLAATPAPVPTSQAPGSKPATAPAISLPTIKAAVETHPQVDAAKKAAEPGHAVPGASAAFHDGGAGKALGQDDEVMEQVKGQDKIAAVFPSTPDGMVMAALYELHRGDKRSMAEIMADHTAAHWARGADAAVEQTAQGDWTHGRGLNDDGDATKHGQVVGHVHQHKKEKGQLVEVDAPIGPIQAYKTAAGMGTFSQGKDPMWCGAFVTYCLARCGVDVGTLKYVPSIAGKIAKNAGTLFEVDSVELDDGGGDRHKAKYKYAGGYHEGKPGQGENHLEKKKIDSAEAIDIRPGDIFYTDKHTGIIAGVNKTPAQIVVRTIEGNSGDKVTSNVRTIDVKNGVITNSAFKGWGRPSQFGELAAPANEDWIHTGKGKHNDEGKTT